MPKTYYLLKTSNDKYFVGCRTLDRFGDLEDVYFDDDPNTAMKINNNNTAQTVAEKYGFIVYKVTVTTEMERV